MPCRDGQLTKDTNVFVAPRLLLCMSGFDSKKGRQATRTGYVRNVTECLVRILLMTYFLGGTAMYAQLITISGSGHFPSRIDLCSGHCDVPDINIGTGFTFTLTYDSSSVPELPNNWILHIPPNQFIVSVGSHTFAAQDLSSRGFGTMQISTLQPPRPGTFSAGGGGDTLTYPFNIPATVAFSLVLSGPGDLFPSGAMPTTFPP